MRLDERQRTLSLAQDLPSGSAAAQKPRGHRTHDELAGLEAEFDQVDISNAVILQEQQARFGMPYRSLRDILSGTQSPAVEAPGRSRPARDALTLAAEEKRQASTGSDRRRRWWVGRPRAPRRKSQLGVVAFRRLDREQRTRLWFHAQAMEQRTKEPRQHGGVLRRTGLAVLRALLFDFLNMQSGRCDPGHEAIAQAAGVAVSTVAPALDRLETSGLLQRIRRAYWGRNALGGKILLQDTVSGNPPPH